MTGSLVAEVFTLMQVTESGTLSFFLVFFAHSVLMEALETSSSGSVFLSSSFFVLFLLLIFHLMINRAVIIIAAERIISNQDQPRGFVKLLMLVDCFFPVEVSLLDDSVVEVVDLVVDSFIVVDFVEDAESLSVQAVSCLSPVDSWR